MTFFFLSSTQKVPSPPGSATVLYTDTHATHRETIDITHTYKMRCRPTKQHHPQKTASISLSNSPDNDVAIDSFRIYDVA